MTSDIDGRDQVGAGYLAHVTEADLRALIRADQTSDDDAAVRIQAVRREPALVLDILDRPGTSASLLNLVAGGQRFTFISPFLVFAAAIHRTAADLASSSYAPERAGVRMRVPVFDSPQLVAHLAEPRRRLFLVELLASFARISSGVTLVRTPRGLRRQRWNELDPSRLALLLEAVPESERPGIWRRLGDAALFLAGVFPDAAQRGVLGRLDDARLARLTGLSGRPIPDRGPAELLEWFGPRWYQLAGARTGPTASAADQLPDNTEHFHVARRVLNTATDRYLFPINTEWFHPPG